MITLRPASTLGKLKTDKLQSLRSFSNNSYYNSAYMGINELLVINDDSQQVGGVVPKHPHANVEIISYQVAGATNHIDSMGNNVVDLPGNVYLMSSGKGLTHSETNTFEGESRYIQIWFKSNVKGTTPTFARMTITSEEKMNALILLASAAGPHVMKVNTAKLYAGIFTENFTHALDPTKKYYVYVVSGSMTVNGTTIQMRDAVTLTEETTLNITFANTCEVLFFEL